MPDMPFITRFLHEKSSATPAEKKKLQSLQQSLNELCGNELEQSNIYTTVANLGKDCQTPAQVINLLTFVLMPFFREKTNLNQWHQKYATEISTQISSLNLKLATDPNNEQIKCQLKVYQDKWNTLTESTRNLAFPRFYPAKIYLATSFLNKHDIIQDTPFVNIAINGGVNNDKSVRLLNANDALLTYTGEPFALKNFSTIKDINGADLYLLCDTTPFIFYYPTCIAAGKSSPLFEQQQIVNIHDNPKFYNYNFDLTFVNDYLKIVYSIANFPALLNLDLKLITRHASNILTLPHAWFSKKSIALLNFLGEKKLTPHIFKELAKKDPNNTNEYQEIFETYFPLLQLLQETFTEVFPAANLPQSIPEFKPYIKDSSFLNALLAIRVPNLFDNEELFDSSDVANVIFAENDPARIVFMIEAMSANKFFAVLNQLLVNREMAARTENDKPHTESATDIISPATIPETTTEAASPLAAAELPPTTEQIIYALRCSGNKLSAAHWGFILMQFANDGEHCPTLIEHFSTFYPNDYIGILCDILLAPNIARTPLAAHLLQSNVLSIANLYDQSSRLNNYQRNALIQLFSHKSMDFMRANFQILHQPDSTVIQHFHNNSSAAIIEKLRQSLYIYGKSMGFHWSETKQLFTENTKDLHKTFVLAQVNNLLQELDQQPINFERLISQIKTMTSSVQEEESNLSTFKVLFSLHGQLLSGVLTSMTRFLVTKQERKQKLLAHLHDLFLKSKYEDIIALFLNPGIYYKLDANELASFFSMSNADIFIKIIVQYYGPEQYRPFALNGHRSIQFDDLARLFYYDKNPAGLDEHNKLRHELGLPLYIPAGAVYSGVHYISDRPLPPAHNYQFDVSDMAAAEQVLRLKYPYHLLNNRLPEHVKDEKLKVEIQTPAYCEPNINDQNPYSASAPPAEMIEVATTMPYSMLLIPACTAHLVPPSNEEEVKEAAEIKSEVKTKSEAEVLFEKFKSQLLNLLNILPHFNKDKPVIVCGGLHVNKNHYIPYFLFQDSPDSPVQFLALDPSADNPNLPDGEKTTKQKAQIHLQECIKQIFPNCEFIAANVTLQYRERDCGANTVDVIENALRTATSNNPLLSIKDGKLVFNETALWRNGARYRHYDPCKNAYFYTQEFVLECYRAREQWNTRLEKVKRIDYFTFEGLEASSSKYPPQTLQSILTETSNITEKYNFAKNVKAQNNQDTSNESYSIIAGLLFSIPVFQGTSDLLTAITDEFIRSFRLPSPERLTSFANLLREHCKKENLVDDTLETLSISNNQSLEELINRVITDNLRPHFLTALNNQIHLWLKQLSHANIAYHASAEACLAHMMQQNYSFAYFYHRLNEQTQSEAMADWVTQTNQVLIELKIKQALDEIKRHFTINFASYFHLYADSNTFAQHCITSILQDQNHPCHHAANFLIQVGQINNCVQQTNLLLQEKTHDYLRSLSTDIVAAFSIGNIIIDNTFIQEHYNHVSQTFDCCSSASFMGWFKLLNRPTPSLSVSLLELAVTHVNTAFTQRVERKLLHDVNTLALQFLRLSDVTATLNSYPEEILHELQQVTAPHLYPHADGSALSLHPLLVQLIQQFGNQINFPSSWLALPQPFVHLIHAFQQNLPALIEQMLENRFSVYYDLVVTALVKGRLTDMCLPFNQHTIQKLLEDTHPPILETSLLGQAILQHTDTLIFRANDLLLSKQKLQQEITYVQRLMTNPHIQNLLDSNFDIAELNTLSTLDIDGFLLNHENLQQGLTQITQQLNQFKQKLVLLIKQLMQKNLASSRLADSHTLRQILISLTGITTYFNPRDKKAYPFPYFILDLDTAKMVDNYLLTTDLPISDEHIEHTRLSNIADIDVLQPLPYLPALNKQATSSSAKVNVQADIIPPNFSPIALNKDHHLTLRTIRGAIASWINLYSAKESCPPLIPNLNAIISKLPIANEALDAPLSRSMVNQIRHVIDQHSLNSKRQPGADLVAYYLMTTVELKNINVLSIRFLRHLLAVYKNSAMPMLEQDLQRNFDTEQFANLRAFGRDTWFKNLRSSPRIKELEQLLTYWAHSDISYDDNRLTQEQIAQLTRFVKRQLIKKLANNPDYYLTTTQTHADKLFISIAKYLIQEKRLAGYSDYLLQWLMPQQFTSLNDLHFPRAYCEAWGYDYETSSIDDIEWSNAIILESGYMVDITWILQIYKNEEKLINPYTGEDLTQQDIKKILSSTSPLVNDLIDNWLAIQQKTGKLHKSNLTQRCIDALVEFCRDAFFVSGLSGYYDATEQELFNRAAGRLTDKLGTFTNTEREMFYKYPVPVLNSNKTDSLKSVMDTPDHCVTGVIKRLALVVYAYAPERIKELHERVQRAVNGHHTTNPIQHCDYGDIPVSDKIGKSVLIEILKNSKENFVDIDVLFYQTAIQRHKSKPQNQPEHSQNERSAAMGMRT